VYDISRAIQIHCEKNGYSLTRELSGHGIGKYLHEQPSIPNFVPPLLQRNYYPNEKLVNGMALAIEPMVHQGKKDVYVASDGWTIYTADKKPAAHYEHTIIVDDNQPIILTLR
jgi:methionyl aminopeptidase